MKTPATTVENYEELEDTSRRASFTRLRPPKGSRTRSRRRKSSANKVGCGFAARRNKRWTW